MCVFCKIINQEIPSYTFYEDEKTIAILDIKPVNPGHSLVIPKNHVSNLEEIEGPDLAELILVVKKVGALLKDRLGVSGYNLVVNNDPVAGQEIPHLHFHLIPREEGDGLKLFPQSEYQTGKIEEILNKLLANNS